MTQPDLTTRWRLSLFFALLVLSGCGGGGSGGGASAIGTPPLSSGATAVAFATHPQSTTVGTGTSVTLSVTTTGTEPIALQWQQSLDDGVTWWNPPEATGTSYAIPNTSLAQSQIKYRVTASNSLGSAISQTALVLVQPNVRLLAGGTGGLGRVDGAGAGARLGSITAMTTDANGNVYVADQPDGSIRRITPAGEVGPYLATNEVNPPITALVFDRAGNLFVARQKVILKVSPQHEITPWLGTVYSNGILDGTADKASMRFVSSMAFDSRGNLVILEYLDRLVRSISPDRVLTTLAGSTSGATSPQDGIGAAATFVAPNALAVDGEDSLYIGDGAVIRKMTRSGEVTRFAGSFSTFGSNDGDRLTGATFWRVQGLAFDRTGNLYVSEPNALRRVNASGQVVTLAGGAAWPVGGIDGNGASAIVNGAAFVSATDVPDVFVFADVENGTVRTLTPAGEVRTLAGANPQIGLDDGPLGVSRFKAPTKLALHPDGSLLVIDEGLRLRGGTVNYGVLRTYGPSIRRISKDGLVTTLPRVEIDTEAYPRYLGGVAVDKSGAIYVSMTDQGVIVKSQPNGTWAVWAGVPLARGVKDGARTSATFFNPTSLAWDAAGNLWVADFADNTHVIRRINANGEVSTVAGGLTSTAAGACAPVNGDGALARICSAGAFAVEPSGSLVFVDSSTSIRRVSGAGVVTTVAGIPNQRGNNDGPAARFGDIGAIATDAAGNIYVGDQSNASIRVIMPINWTKTVVGKAGNAALVPGLGGQTNSPYGLVARPDGRLLWTSEYAVVGD